MARVPGSRRRSLAPGRRRQSGSGPASEILRHAVDRIALPKKCGDPYARCATSLAMPRLCADARTKRLSFLAPLLIYCSLVACSGPNEPSNEADGAGGTAAGGALATGGAGADGTLAKGGPGAGDSGGTVPNSGGAGGSGGSSGETSLYNPCPTPPEACTGTRATSSTPSIRERASSLSLQGTSRSSALTSCCS